MIKSIFVGWDKECVKLESSNIQFYIGIIRKYNTSFMFDSNNILECSDFVKKTILVQLDFKTEKFYVELDKFYLNDVKSKIDISDEYGVNVIIDESGLIMTENPYFKNNYFIDKNSLKKYDYKQGIATGISSKKNEKVKQLVREINQKGE